MAYIVLQISAPNRAEVQRLKQNLVKSWEDAQAIKRQIDEMDDIQIQEQYGVPSAAVTSFRNNIAGIVTTLGDASVENIISSLGFNG